MEIIKLTPSNFDEVVSKAARALRAGKTVVYPTDTSYGLGALATSTHAIEKIYLIKKRDRNKPIHVLVPSLSYAKKIVQWGSEAQKKFAKFLPGALTVVLPLKQTSPALKRISSNGYLGVRIPDNKFALALARKTAAPITATSANLSGGLDPYNLQDIVDQFKRKKAGPDLVIDVGNLKKVKPSTVAKLENHQVTILRQGPVVIK